VESCSRAENTHLTTDNKSAAMQRLPDVTNGAVNANGATTFFAAVDDNTATLTIWKFPLQ
jgi:hypothetical protein